MANEHQHNLVCDFLDSDEPFLSLGPAPETAPLVFPGAFNPLHRGHLEMARIAEQRTGRCLHFEISVENVDKPTLAPRDVSQRLGQFAAGQPVLITKAAKFIDKAKLFPGAMFVVGCDTLARMVDVRYYHGDREAMEASVREFCGYVQTVYVFGRLIERQFHNSHDVRIPQVLRDVCVEVPENEYRQDISSTELRKN